MRIDWTWAKNKRDNYPRGKRGWITDICISTFRYPAPERTYLILSQLDTRQFASLDLRRTRDLVSLLSPVNYTSIEHRQRNRAAMHTPRRIWSRATLVRITYQFWISRNHCPVPLIQHWIICVCPKIGTSVVISLLFFIRSSNRFFDTRLIWFDRRPLFELNILFFCKRTKWWGEMTNWTKFTEFTIYVDTDFGSLLTKQNLKNFEFYIYIYIVDANDKSSIESFSRTFEKWENWLKTKKILRNFAARIRWSKCGR